MKGKGWVLLTQCDSLASLHQFRAIDLVDPSLNFKHEPKFVTYKILQRIVFKLGNCDSHLHLHLLDNSHGVKNHSWFYQYFTKGEYLDDLKLIFIDSSQYSELIK